MTKVHIGSFEKKRNEEGRIIIKELELDEGIIEIYEPNQNEIEEIQEYMIDNTTEDSIDITEIGVIKYLIPKLTNLDLSDVEEDYVYGLIDENPLWLRKVRIEIKNILNDINEIRTLELKNQIKSAESTLLQLETLDKIPANIAVKMDKATKDLKKKNPKLYKLMESATKNNAKEGVSEEEKKERELLKQLQEKYNK